MKADVAARKVFVAANRTFNAPIDREDILQLAHELDDAVDLIEDTAKGIARYEVHAMPARDARHGRRDRRQRGAPAQGHAVPRLGDARPPDDLRAVRGDRADRGPRRRVLRPGPDASCARSFARARSTPSPTSTARSSTSSSSTSSTSATTSPTPCSRSPPSTSDPGPWTPTALALPVLIGAHRGRAAVRLPERPARRRQLDRDGGGDPRAAPADRRRLGGVLQLHRVPGVRPARRADGRHGHRQRRASSTAR